MRYLSPTLIFLGLLNILACGDNATTTNSGGSGGATPSGGMATGGTTGTTMNGTGASGTGGSPPGTVPVFVAQGHLGRTTISCDGGKSWIKNQSKDDTKRCFEKDVDGKDIDCDHSPYAGRGIAYGNGHFVMTWGWSSEEIGTVQRSKDGATWEDVLTKIFTLADVAYGKGIFVTGGSPSRISQDGKSWMEGGAINVEPNIRSIDFVAHQSGRFIVTADAKTDTGEKREIVYSDDGKVWTKAKQRPDACGGAYRGIAYGGGVTVLASTNGNACSSKDGGETWEIVKVGDNLSSPVVFTGKEFLVFGGSTRYKSTDGVKWQNDTTEPDNISIGPMARGDDGTLVATNEGWMEWYEKQQFYRSTDGGKKWEVLDKKNFVGSHPINFISFGYVEPGAGCPAK